MNEETRLVPKDDGPAPVTVEELSTKIVAALDLLASIIPDLRTPHPATSKRVRGARTVSREAVSSIIAMVEAFPNLQRIHTFDADRAHEVLDSTDGYRLVAERLDMLRARVKYTAEARWAEVVAQAMSTYYIACGLAKDASQGELAAHVATIRGHLGRRNGATGKRKKEPAGTREKPSTK